jgi:tetratricopeptide (TPR) repeat protein
MRRAISTSVAAVALMLYCVSLSPAQTTPRAASSRRISMRVATPPAPAPAPSVRSRRDVNCSVSRGRLLGGSGGVLLTAPNVLYYPLGYRYTPSYGNYYMPAYDNTYTLGNREATGATLQAENRGSSRARRVRSRYDLTKSEKLIASGDAKFAEKQYVLAIARYREAARAAPDASEARLRQALALIAAEKYSAAARVIDEALALRADWNDSTLHLDQLYARGELAKTTRVLTDLVESDPRDAELALALGAQLFFSGQREKAEPYFSRAARLGGERDGRLSAFLPLGQVAQAAN